MLFDEVVEERGDVAATLELFVGALEGEQAPAFAVGVDAVLAPELVEKKMPVRALLRQRRIEVLIITPNRWNE